MFQNKLLPLSSVQMQSQW